MTNEKQILKHTNTSIFPVDAKVCLVRHKRAWLYIQNID